MAENIYLVVVDPTTESQVAFDRALQSAQLSGAGLHLFLCAHDYLGDDKDAVLQRGRALLDGLVAQAEAVSVAAATELVWEERWAAAAAAAAGRVDCTMVFNTSHYHTLSQRAVQTGDYTLLRECHCPVMLLHNNTDWKQRRVLAAVNFAATDTAHQELNRQVIAIAHNYQDEYQAEVHYINALSQPEASTAVSASDDDLLLVNTWSEDDSPVPTAEKAAITLDYVAKQCRAPQENIHLPSGFSVDQIVATAREVKPDVIIIGTVARRGIKGKVLGNTTERLLDRVECDILTLAR